jgi:16S rRNA G527 N7-methylase RsmG
MVRFAVFNDYSLPFLSDKNIKEKFIEFFKLLAEINNKGLSTLRVPNELKERYVLDGINFKQFIGQQRASLSIFKSWSIVSSSFSFFSK